MWNFIPINLIFCPKINDEKLPPNNRLCNSLLSRPPSGAGGWGSTVSSDGLERSEPGMLETGENFVQSTYLGGPQIPAPP